ncbi:MAG TPA: pyruvate dehydrogenase (acetyl-transferring) E1 component subunit alpha [Acidimicrobiia bacterium]|nr:pyruvate dehydrogenase (acetyl-transferring) E1 component subunit alpha [Acidimicrobiia bacterium]
MFRLLTPDGTVLDRLPVSLDQMKGLYADMVEARTFDNKSMALQRQGRLATYAPFRGQEAAQIGAAAALSDDDWVVATYRDAALNWRAGYPWRALILGRTGDERGGDVPEGVNVLPPSITVGGHMIHAVGLAWAEKLAGRDRISLTSFGDGATSEGDFHEAMNFAAVYQTPTVFLCQNNGYAISYPVEEQTRSESIAIKADAYGMPGVQVDGNDVVAVLTAVREAAARARSGNGPSLIEAVTYRLGPHTTADDPTRYRDDAESGQWESKDPLERVRLLLEKQGTWNQEWQKELERSAAETIDEAVEWAESVPEPTFSEMVHRMYARPTAPLLEQLRQNEGEKLSSESQSEQDPRPGSLVGTPVEGITGEVNLAQALNSALDTALANDERVVLLGEDIGRTGGVFRITEGLRERYGPERVFDTPVAESGIVGAAFGMAVDGLRPVAEIQFLGFSYPACDQIINHVARIRNRTNHRFTAPMVIRIPYGGGIGAAEHHSESTEAIYAHIPGIKVVVPSTPGDARALLLATIDDPDPVIFLEPIRLYRAVKEDLTGADTDVEIGPIRIERSGHDITLISWGAMMKETRAAATALEAEGVSVEVIDVRTLSPLDRDGIVASVEKTGRAVVIHEAPLTGGLGGEIAATISERALYSLQTPVRRVTGWDTIFPLKRSEGHYLPSVERIIEDASEILEE